MLLVVPSSGILKLQVATFPGPLVMQPQLDPGINYRSLTFPVFCLGAHHYLHEGRDILSSMEGSLE